MAVNGVNPIAFTKGMFDGANEASRAFARRTNSAQYGMRIESRFVYSPSRGGSTTPVGAAR
jgi:hypothetical protein